MNNHQKEFKPLTSSEKESRQVPLDGSGVLEFFNQVGKAKISQLKREEIFQLYVHCTTQLQQELRSQSLRNPDHDNLDHQQLIETLGKQGKQAQEALLAKYTAEEIYAGLLASTGYEWLWATLLK
jgi:hypothetical protein